MDAARCESDDWDRCEVTRVLSMIGLAIVGCGAESERSNASPSPTPSPTPSSRHYVDIGNGREVAIELEPDGKLELLRVVRDGRGEGPSILWRRGKLVGIGNETSKGFEGMQHSFRESGELLSSEHFVNGKAHGPFRQWFETGELQRIGDNDQGFPVGQWVERFPSGEVRIVESYFPPTPSDIAAPKFRPLKRSRRCTPREPLIEDVRDGKRLANVPDCPRTPPR